MILISAGFCRRMAQAGRLCAKRQKSEIFCLTAKGEIFGHCPQVKSNAYAFGEMKSTHRRRGDFTARRAISPPQAISPTPQGWISLPTVLQNSRQKRRFFCRQPCRRGAKKRRDPTDLARMSTPENAHFLFLHTHKYMHL